MGRIDHFRGIGGLSPATIKGVFKVTDTVLMSEGRRWSRRRYTRVMHRLLAFLMMFISLACVAAEPVDLSSRLSKEMDGDTQWQTPGLYALLQAVAAWPEDAALMPRAADLALIQADPAAYRGQVFSVEGWLQQVERVALKRPGLDYGDKLTRWAVLIGEGGLGSADQVALIYLVDPSGQWAQAEPSARQIIRVEAMFFKTLELPAQTGQAERFPVFVGRVNQSFLQAESGDGSGGGLAWVLGGVGLGLVALWFVRGLRRRAPVRRRKAEIRGDALEASLRDDLPDDPAEALNVLAGEVDASEELRD